MRAGPVSSATLLALVATACGTGGAGPVSLRFGDPETALPLRVEYTQVIEWGPTEVTRELRGRYTRGVGDPETARLDSLSIAISTPHGRQVLSARHLLGRTFGLAARPAGGPPAYGPDVPVVDLGSTNGGETSVGFLIDYGFPDLPEGPVAVGDTWRGEKSRRQVEANLVGTATLTTDYRFAGLETVHGTPCARIEGVTRGTIEGDDDGRTYAGTLEGNASWCLDAASGTLVQMASGESSAGEIRDGEARVRIRQRTDVRIDRAASP